MSSLFQKNLSQAILISPLHAHVLDKQETKHFELIENENLNLKTVEFGFYHDEKDPLKEAVQLFQNTSKEDIKVICCYGLGLGYLADAAEEWLLQDPSRALLFFENDAALIAKFLSTSRAEKIVNNPQIKIIPYPELKGPIKDEVLDTFLVTYLWSYQGKSHVSIFLPSYASKKKEECELFKRVIQDAFNRVELHYGFLNQTSFKVLVNYLQNSLSNVPYAPTRSLQGRFKNVPAIICGAGASILKEIDLLKELKDKALLFAGGTSVAILNNHGIEPHIGAVIDPEPNVGNFMKQSSFEMPFLYKSRSGCEIISRYHGLRLLTPDIFESAFIEWVSEKFEREGDKQTASFWTVTDFLFDQACTLGCNPIILVGVDLAMTQDQYYADKDLSFVNVKKFVVQKKDIHGKEINTKWDWVYCSEKITELLLKYPDTKVFNASSEGIGVKGAPNVSLKECARKYLVNVLNTDGLLYSTILNQPLKKCDKDKAISVLEELIKSLENCFALIGKMEIELTILFTNWQIKSLDELNPYEGRLRELDDLLKKEVAFSRLLNPFWKVYRKFLHSTSSAPENPQKFKLTFFGMRVREFQYYKGIGSATSIILNLSKQYLLSLYSPQHSYTPSHPEAHQDPLDR